jgi:adenylate kinase
MFHLYFIGGTFGAGKSTLCKTLGQLLPGEHLKASELINFIPNPDDTTGKSTDQVISNQERLIEALAIRRASDGTVLLDGHFCLIDDTYTIVRLPIDVFQRLNPSALVLVESNPDEIVNRIKLRDGRDINPDIINQLVQAEREHSQFISEVLRVPIMIVNSLTPIINILAFLQSSSLEK